MPDEDRDEPGRRPTDDLLDVIVYAPIALALDARTVVPELAEKGRQHARAARTLGEMAVTQGVRWLRTTCAEAVRHATPTTTRPDDGTHAGPASDAGPPDQPEAAPSGQAAAGEPGGAPDAAATPVDAPAVETLAIPEYDSLAASQVVQRLRGLTADELEAIRQYELANRGRRTILSQVARLQTSD